MEKLGVEALGEVLQTVVSKEERAGGRKWLQVTNMSIATLSVIFLSITNSTELASNIIFLNIIV
jgi:leucyl-tRNA synthetase